MKLYQPITVDLHNPHPLPKMNAQQYNVGRGALITLTANGQIITLSEETVRVFAQRPDGNVYYLDCVITEDGKIQADFTDQMLAVKGSMEVELEFTTADSNITTPIFIVEVNKSNVKEGVESSNEFKALEKYTEEAKEAANKAQEVYDDIPNYEEKLAELEAYKANAILSTTQGTTPTTTDAANVPPVNLKVFGKSEQKTYAGNQLLDLANPSDNIRSAIEVNEDELKLTTIQDTDGGYDYVTYSVDVSELNGITDLTLSVQEMTVISSATPMIAFGLLDANESILNLTMLKSAGSATLTLTDDTQTVAVSVYSNYGGTCDANDGCIYTGLMLNSGKVTKTWEPYVGGITYPSPDIPCEIVSVGDGGSVAVALRDNNNLFDSSLRIMTIDCTHDGNGVFTISEPPTSGSYMIVFETSKKILPNTYVSISFDIGLTTATVVECYVFAGDFTSEPIEVIPFFSRDSVTHIELSGLITTEPEAMAIILQNDASINCVISDGEVEIRNIQITVDTQRLTLSTPTGLRGIEVTDSSLATYTDSDGKMWCADEIDLERGKYVQRIGIIDSYDGEEITTPYMSTTGELSTGATVHYILTEPIETDLTTEEIEQYKTWVMNYPNNTLINDAGAYTELEYVQDTKTYINEAVTADSIKNILGYTPANQESVDNLSKENVELEECITRYLYVESDNIYDESKATINKNINASGNIVDSNNYKISDFIPVPFVGGDNYLYQNNDAVGSEYADYKGIHQICLYDESKTFITRIAIIGNPIGSFNNSTAKYMRFTIGINTPDLMVVASDVYDASFNPTFVPYGNGYVDKLVSEMKNVVADCGENNTEKPLEHIIKDGGLTAIFRTIGVVGDSLSSGCMELVGGTSGIDMYEHSWIQHIGRICGSTAYNFSVGGLTAEKFWTTTNQYVAKLRDDGANHKCEAYFIALGVNDIADTTIEVGTSADIDNADSTTFYGYYSRIVKLIQNIQPKAKIFLVGLPNHDKMVEWGARFTNFKNAIADMVNHFNNCYYIDLFNNEVSYDTDFKKIYFNGFHENALGYVRTAWVISSYVDWYIRHNYEEFREVGFIGTDYYYYE